MVTRLSNAEKAKQKAEANAKKNAEAGADVDDSQKNVGSADGSDEEVKEDTKPTKEVSLNPLKNRKNAPENEDTKKSVEIDVENLSDEQLARLAQRMGVVYNAPKSKIGNRKCFLKIYNDLPVIYIGKAKEGQVHNNLLNVMETKLLYPITTMDGNEYKITHDEYNGLERREYEFERREDLSKEIVLGDPVYNQESKEYVDNVRMQTREVFYVRIDEQLVEVYSDGGAINA